MKIIITIFTISLIALISCTPGTQIPETVPETIIVTETVVIEDTSRIEQLENQLASKEEELQKYQNLIANLNLLLSCVYYGYASNDKYILDGFTAFSMEHKGKYYLITAGHSVENEYGKFGNFKFKANFSDEWIYPELLKYENDFTSGKDFAAFYSKEITKGLKFDLNYSNTKYVLGYGEKNYIKKFYGYNCVPGESGSPVININGKVIGIATGIYTDIDTVLEAIDNLE